MSFITAKQARTLTDTNFYREESMRSLGAHIEEAARLNTCYTYWSIPTNDYEKEVIDGLLKDGGFTFRKATREELEEYGGEGYGDDLAGSYRISW